MFSKAEWFQQAGGSGWLRPATWQGWLYSTGWLGVLIVPALMLADVRGWPEALIWAAAMSAGWWLDLRPVRQAHRPGKEVFVIDESTDITRLSTDNYEMTLKN